MSSSSSNLPSSSLTHHIPAGNKRKMTADSNISSHILLYHKKYWNEFAVSTLTICTMNELVAISDQVCNKWLVSTHLSVNNSPVQLIFNQSALEPCSVNRYWQRGLHHPMQMTPRMPRIIIIIKITIITFRHHRPMQMTPGVPKQFQPHQVIAGCRVVNSRTYCSYTALLCCCCLLLIVVDVFYDFLGSNTLQATSLSP